MNKIRTTTHNCQNGIVITVAAGIIIIFLVMIILHEAFALTSEEIRRLGIEARSSGSRLTDR
ncbi:MAG TPA: hypothetical protein VFI70_09970 [Nitrososphaeraceae archaeon]|nr:hypothetical protein [Nitrososphaeraceae archaeon]